MNFNVNWLLTIALMFFMPSVILVIRLWIKSIITGEFDTLLFFKFIKVVSLLDIIAFILLVVWLFL